MQTTAVADGPGHYRISGTKMWISNGGIADHYVVFARTGEAPGARGLSAFVVDRDAPGFSVAERIEVIAPHPLAKIPLTAFASPPPAVSASLDAASMSPWGPWTSFARRLPRRRSALPVAR